MRQVIIYGLVGLGCFALGFCGALLITSCKIGKLYSALNSVRHKAKEKEEKILALLTWVNGEIEKKNYHEYTARHAWRDCLEWSAGLIQDENFIIYRLMNKKHRKPKAEVSHD